MAARSPFEGTTLILSVCGSVTMHALTSGMDLGINLLVSLFVGFLIGILGNILAGSSLARSAANFEEKVMEEAYESERQVAVSIEAVGYSLVINLMFYLGLYLLNVGYEENWKVLVEAKRMWNERIYVWGSWLRGVR